MALSDNRLNSILSAQLDTVERKQGVVYVLLKPIRAGATFDFPNCRIEAPWDALLAFVDRDPLANWGHSSRYVLINRDNGEAKSISSRFPPFQGGGDRLAPCRTRANGDLRHLEKAGTAN